MFFDWLSIYQDHDDELPILGDRHFIAVDTATCEALGTVQPTLQHPGSYSTSISIRISGRRVTVSGNPSRVNRLDNLFGYASIDHCVAVYNRILAQYGLPPFTRATRRWQAQSDENRIITDGATITEIHVTANVAVGQGNEQDFIKAVSTLPYRNSVPRLHTNGNTCDWLTKKGKGGSLIYPSCYNKAHEIALHTLPKIKRTFGDESQEFLYLSQVIEFCKVAGVVRFEQKLKSAFLRRFGLNHYGFEDIDIIRQVHAEFLKLPGKLEVEAMTLESITQQLLNAGICDTTRAANTTTLYAIQWMHGEIFDLRKRQVKEHRARLKKIGIDIALPCDLTKFALVKATAARRVEVTSIVAPTWYRKPEIFLQAA